MRLINLPVVVAEGVTEAKHLIMLHQPHLVLARLNLKREVGGAVTLARDLSAHPVLKSLPVVLLLTEEEKQAQAFPLDLFCEQWLLPVLFPGFTEKVQAFLSRMIREGRGVAWGPHDERASPPASAAHKHEHSESSAPVVTPGGQPGIIDNPSAPSLMGRLGIVYEIHLQVFRALEASREFHCSEISEIPKIVADLTQWVCKEWGRGSSGLAIVDQLHVRRIVAKLMIIKTQGAR